MPVDKQEEGSARENPFVAVHGLKDYFDGELDLSFRDGGPEQHAGGSAGIAGRRR